IPARLSGYSFAAALVIGKDYHRGYRHRFCAMSGKHLWPDIVFAPCRGSTSDATSFLRHVAVTPLARRRFCAISGYRRSPADVPSPCRGNTSGPTSFLRHVGEPLLVPLFPGEGTSPAPPQYPDTKTPAGRMTGGCL